ncbi:hypothetical protein [Okeania sp. SIO2B3]|uniref:hypothetical protein n=1 Tax=Okeania sp. SIO2B3 TaxID=2607784 RepID=UPI0013C22F55|nr:hypothetical protein [Okeania sp. SIO2B3]NET43020.1 hypothetical protein [Okeania sp. SIO2B3]
MFKVDLEQEICMVPNRFSFYWNYFSNFPETFSQIVKKLPKLLNIKNGALLKCNGN